MKLSPPVKKWILGYSGLRFASLFAFLLLCSASGLRAQISSGDPVSFVYQTGYVTSMESFKVLLISSHLIDFKEDQLGSTTVETQHFLNFGKLLERIEFDEAVPGWNDYDNLAFNSPTVEVITTALHPEISRRYSILSSDTKREAALKIRTGIIEEHLARGYKVYQIDFDPARLSDYKYLATGSGWQDATLRRHDALSPLYVPRYRKGEIRSMVEDLGERLSVVSTGLTVESKTSSEAEKSEINYVLIAQGLELEGDAFVRSEGPFSENALLKYQEAYSYAPTEELRQKIAQVSSLAVASEGIAHGVVGIENALDKWDVPTFFGWQLTYAGGMKVEASPGVKSEPFHVDLQLASYRLIAYNFGFSYSSSPSFQYSLMNQNSQPVSAAPAEFTQQNVNLSFALGVGIPIKSLVLYGLYGAEFPIFQNYTLLSTQYSEASDFADSFKHQLRPYGKFGIHFSIPKTALALGVQYSIRSFKSEKILELGSVNTEMRAGSSTYYLHKPLSDSYRYNLFGVSLIYKLHE
ncbi:hypothetical protein [Chryseobacterium sp. A321]